MKRRALRVALRLVGPVVLTIVLLRMDDREAIWSTVAGADLPPLALAVALVFVNLHLKVVRWDVLLRTRGIRYPLGRAWGAYLSSAYVGMLTPGRVGDVLRVQYLRRDRDVSYAEGLASVVMDRLCDLYVLVVFAAVGFVRFSSVLVGELAYIAWAIVAATVLGPLILLVPGVAEKLLSRAYQKLSRQADAGGFDRFLEALRANVGRALALTLPLTIAAFLVNYAQAWLAARALHLDLSFFDLMCLLSIASLLGLLPISISGVGVRELFFALAFPVLGLTAAAGVSFGLLIFVVINLVVILAGFVSWQLYPPPTAA